MKSVRIGGGQGFWGDSPGAPLELVQNGSLDYLVLDYLAEVTMSLLVRQQQKHPSAGFPRDFPQLVASLAPALLSSKTRVIANAGGMNPVGCAQAVRTELDRAGVGETLRIGIVEGDNILGDIDRLIAEGESFDHMDDHRFFAEVRSQLVSANVYLGCESVADALSLGADIVICGRVADPALALGALVYEFGWKNDDWDRLAAGVVAGHAIECGAQATGGNFLADWESVENLGAIGYPIAVVSEDGTVVITKPAGSGGAVTCATVAEQLIYEIGDPSRYLTPDVAADFTSFSLTQVASDQVSITGIRGTARPEKLKVSMSYANGFTAQGTMLYSWPQAVKKARRAGEIVFQRLARAGVVLDRTHTEIIGVNACHGALTDGDYPDAPEAMLRVAVQSSSRAAVERFTREVPPLVLNGPPGATSYFGSKGEVREVFAYWPTTLDRNRVTTKVSIA